MNASIVIRHIEWMRMRGLSVRTIELRTVALTSLTSRTGKPLEAVTRDDVLAWRKSLRVAPDTIAQYVSQVRQFYRWAVDERQLKVNPAVGIPVPRLSRRLPRPISEADLAKALRSGPDRDMRLMLVLTCLLGLRCCEIAGLRWESINIAARLLIVTRETSKGGYERLLPLSSRLVAELERFGVRSSGWIFARLDGKPGPPSARRVSQRIASYLDGCGLKARAHCGRHRFATKALQTGHNIREVQELLGHASLATTQIYLAFDEAAARQTLENMPWPGLTLAC